MKRTLCLFMLGCALIPLLLSACQAASASPTPQSVQSSATSLPTQASTDTKSPDQDNQPPSDTTGEITLELSGVAQDQSVETVAAMPAGEGVPPWDVLPEYRRVTLQDYAVANHFLKPQIFIYPLADLAQYNEGAGQIAASLQALLQSQQAGENLPFLPLFNASQVLHAQVQYLSFKNGAGVRFLTQFDQAPLPVNSFELFYTFQGVTSDGKYYVAAVLPVTHPDLPSTAQVSAEQAEDLNDFPAYLAETVSWLEQQPASSFTPDLTLLDALIQSMEVK